MIGFGVWISKHTLLNIHAFWKQFVTPLLDILHFADTSPTKNGQAPPMDPSPFVTFFDSF